ncbi:transposase [Olivibacter sitiensis]|uniref:transposase n=1 Tax=Olivibacter sitiensis TaxID=376470 RepID=UPI0004850EAC|nr:transposase [Olivibacter sitiensis]
MSFNPNIHHRRSIRLKGYDYAQTGAYFITLCCQKRAHLFGEIVNGKMILNEYGLIAHDEWENTLEIRPNISLGAFVIMPNHVHGILIINDSGEPPSTTPKEENKFKSPSKTIGAIIRGYKGATTKRIKRLISTGESPISSGAPKIDLSTPIWQRNYYEHIIRNEKAFYNISNYIINNPAKWAEDKFYK